MSQRKRSSLVLLKLAKHVVTANKDLLAVHGAELLEIAQKQNVALYYEAAVAGGIPILRTLVNSLASDKLLVSWVLSMEPLTL